MMKNRVIVSENAVSLIPMLEEYGFDVVCAASNLSVDTRIADHPDISYFFDGDDTLFIANENARQSEFFSDGGVNVIVIDDKLGNEYPYDVKLNCVTVGNNFICNKNTVSSLILDHMTEKGYNIIQVNQGYTKCSVIPVTDNAIITDDLSISEKCCQAGIDVLFVSKGNVTLQGFDYGFIGGSAGVVSNELIVFNGDITLHKDFEAISNFLGKHNVKYICAEGKLTDIGSMLPLYKFRE